MISLNSEKFSARVSILNFSEIKDELCLRKSRNIQIRTFLAVIFDGLRALATSHKETIVDVCLYNKKKIDS